jgi:hypothetical protein
LQSYFISKQFPASKLSLLKLRRTFLVLFVKE